VLMSGEAGESSNSKIEVESDINGRKKLYLTDNRRDKIKNN